MIRLWAKRLLIAGLALHGGLALPAQSPYGMTNGPLLSGRVEGMMLHNAVTTIREKSRDHTRFYFNNIYLNLDWQFTAPGNLIVEFLPETSTLYQFGGFLVIADSLEGIGDEPEDEEETSPRALQVAELTRAGVRELEEAAERPGWERVQLAWRFSDRLAVDLGRVRNPFGFWDDYSLFRNLSALKTDFITLEAPLRRTDWGAVVNARVSGSTGFKLAVLAGERSPARLDSNSRQDAVLNLHASWQRLDLGMSYYRRDVGSPAPMVFGAGMQMRWRLGYDFTLLGEYIYMENRRIDVRTRGAYLQTNYDLSDALAQGLRWNLFIEAYNSDLLKVDLEEDVNYRFAGTILQSSTGFLYALRRNLDIGAQILLGQDEEGDATRKFAFKLDWRF